MNNIGKVVPETITIDDAMRKVCAGEFTVPRFQRDFVWNAKKIASLMQSIGNGFPLGVLLLAETKDSPLSGRNDIFQFLSNSNPKRDGKIVIDGQQRLTSISIVYHATELVEHFKKDRRASKTISDVVKSVCANLCFYESKFYEKDELVTLLIEKEAIEEMHAETNVGKYLISIPDINKLVKKKIGENELFTHTLYNWDDSQIIDIFTSMNQATKPLTHIDLMNGSMFNASDNDFDLLQRIIDFNKLLGNWGKLKGELYVQCLKIFSDLKISIIEKSVNYKADALVKWAGQEDLINSTIKRIDEFEELLKTTISILDTKLDIYSFEMLPKEVYLLVIFSQMCLMSPRENDFDLVLKELISHVTVRLINGDYASSPNAKAQDDINSFLLPKLGLSQKDSKNETTYDEDKVKKQIIEKLTDISYKQKTSALFKLFLATVSSNAPRNLFEGGYVPLKPTAVTKMDKNIHHWIPKNSKTNEDFKFRNIDSIGNLTLIKEDENKNEIRSKNLRDYLNASKDFQGKDFNDVLKSHLFSEEKLDEFTTAIENNLSSIVVHALFEKIIEDRISLIAEMIFKKFIK